MSWEVTITSGPAGPFHQVVPPDGTGPQVWIRRIPTPALVLGSTQPDELVRRAKAEAAGIEVCRRRSGGGLVYIDPETDCWIDLIVPRASRHWDDDIGRAFHWVGEQWASILAESTAPDASGQRGPVDDRPAGAGSPPPPPAPPRVHHRVDRTAAGTVWCFADLGHGEVSIGGSKVVGLSQRRTRTWLRIQSLMVARWPGERLRTYVDLERLARIEPARHPHPDRLDPALLAVGFPPGTPLPDPGLLAERFVATLPAP